MFGRHVNTTLGTRRSLRLAVVALLLLASGCGGVNLRSDTSWGLFVRGHSYGTVLGNGHAMDDIDSGAFARAGQTLRLDYAFAPTHGWVSVGVWPNLDPFDAIYWRSFETTGQGQEAIAIPRTGFYTISVSLWSFNGRYDVAWAVE